MSSARRVLVPLVLGCLLILCNFHVAEASSRSLLKKEKEERDRKPNGNRPGGRPGRPYGGEDDHENENEGEDDDHYRPGGNGGFIGGNGGNGGNGGSLPSNPGPTPAPASCLLTVDNASTNFTSCRTLGNGQTVYYSINGDTLSVGYKVASNGWAGWALGSQMYGASAVFTLSCGTNCTKPYTATMNGYRQSSFVASTVKFTNVKTGRASANELAATFDMPWPSSSSSIPFMVSSGAVSGSTMQQHRGTPYRYNLAKDTLQVS